MKKFFIESTHDVYIDSYKDGELQNVNFYTVSDFISAETVKDAIAKYFETVLYYNFDFNLSDNEDGRLFYSVLVDAENCEATDKQIKVWRMGKSKLYCNNITLTVSECTKFVNFD